MRLFCAVTWLLVSLIAWALLLGIIPRRAATTTDVALALAVALGAALSLTGSKAK